MRVCIGRLAVLLAALFSASAFAGRAADRCPEHTVRSLQRQTIASEGQDFPDPFELLFFKQHAGEFARRLDGGFDVDACGGPFDASLLGTAAALGLTDDVKALVERGADLERPRSARGESALILALSNNRYEIATYLVEKGADVHATYGNDDEYGVLDALAMTLNDGLHNEATERRMAHDLIARGVSPDKKARNPIGETTPLMWAVVSDKPSLVELFVACGANLSLTDKKGRTALDLARQVKNERVLDILAHPPASRSCGL